MRARLLPNADYGNTTVSGCDARVTAGRIDSSHNLWHCSIYQRVLSLLLESIERFLPCRVAHRWTDLTGTCLQY
jgi:hypothetical protein